MTTITANEFTQLHQELNARKDDLRGDFQNDDTIKKLYPYLREQVIQWRSGAWNDADLDEIVGDSIDRTLESVRKGTVIDLKSALRKDLRAAMEHHSNGLHRRHRSTITIDGQALRPRQFVPFISINEESADENTELQEVLLSWWMQPEVEIMIRQRNEMLHSALCKLKRIDRYIIWESSVKGRNQKDIANELGLKSDNVSKRKNRALIKLQEYLGNHFLQHYQI